MAWSYGWTSNDCVDYGSNARRDYNEKFIGLEAEGGVGMSEDLTQPHAYPYIENKAVGDTNYTPPPDDHTLNACLARVIGKSIKEYYTSHPFDPPERKRGPYWYCKDENGSEVVWHPVTNANQMEEVEAWLIEKYKRLALTMHWGGSNWHVTIRVYGEREHEGLDPDKKRAFALAVYQMEQSQKETT